MKRKTSQREAIEQVFSRQDRPLSVAAILKTGRAIVGSLNQATVYRNLKIMVEKGSLQQINHPSLGTLYERTSKGHHHHFYCRGCNRIFEVPGCALNLAKAVPDGFVLEDHLIYLSGFCPTCRE